MRSSIFAVQTIALDMITAGRGDEEVISGATSPPSYRLRRANLSCRRPISPNHSTSRINREPVIHTRNLPSESFE